MAHTPLIGVTEPRIYTPPLRDLTPETSLGFSVIEFANEVIGANLYPWQEWLFIHALEIVGDLDGEWHFRFRTVIVEIARQNGKTFVAEILAEWFMYVARVPLVIGTAQSLDIAEEVWREVVDTIESDEELKAEVVRVSRVNGKKSIELTGGRQYKIAAASRRGGRGLTGDLILLDELREHQTWDAWSAVTKTTMARPNALVWCMSNAGDATSVVLRHLRLTAHARLGDPDGAAKVLGKIASPDEDVVDDDDTIGLFEWSAHPNCSVYDRDEWRYANPSLGYGGITERALASAVASDPEGQFRTECLCQWVETAIESPFPVDSWERGQDAASCIAPDSPLFYGVDVSASRDFSSIAVCGKRADGLWHVELIAYRKGLGWLQSWFADRAVKQEMVVALQGRGAPVSSLADVLSAVDGVHVVECVGKDVSAWTGRFYDAVSASSDEVAVGDGVVPVKHRPQPQLDLAANIAVTKPLGDGAWAWNRNRSVEDISPLVAATMAFGAATQPDQHRSAYDDDDYDLVFL